MDPANIILCLLDLFGVNLNLNKREISQEERFVAQRLANIINSITSCDQFDYEDEITLDLIHDIDDYYNEDNLIYNNDHGSDADDEWNDEENTNKRFQLNNYSTEFMKEVISFADAKDSLGKRRRSWKTVKHRFRSIPDQNYISRFRKYLAQQGTKRQKTQNIEDIVYKIFLNAREQYLPIHDIDIQRWALQTARDMNVNDFQASSSWLLAITLRNQKSIF